MIGPEAWILVGDMSDSSALPMSNVAGEPNVAVGLSDPGGPVGGDVKQAGDSGEGDADARESAGRGDPWNTFPFKRKGGLEGRSPGKPAQVRKEDTADGHDRR